jgi:hypothetical protein
MGCKTVKLLQNREELRQKIKKSKRVKKSMCRQRGEKFIFGKGGGINIVFGPKYRPLCYLTGSRATYRPRKKSNASSV